MISRKTYCRALNLLQAQENLDAEARQILLTLLRDSIDDVCDGKDFVTISILLDADVKEQLDSFCDEHDTTPGQILTTALEWMVHHPEEAKSYLENLTKEDTSWKKKN